MKVSQILWISDSMLQSMIFEAEKISPYETGGVFMGYQADNNDLVVTDIIDAGPAATHKRFSFSPDQNYQLERIAQIYNDSEGTITYLGDWHTHPNSAPELSLIDKKTLTRIASTPRSRNSRPLMVILGGRPAKWTLNSVQFISGVMRPWIFSTCIYNNIQYKIYSN